MSQYGFGWTPSSTVQQPKSLQWIPRSNGTFPPFAITAGIDSGKDLFVARGHHNGGLIPGKLHVGHSSAYISYGGLEISKTEYEVLVGPVASLSWIDGNGSLIPPNAVVGGHDPNGDNYFIGRVCLNGTVTVGKVHQRYGSCFVPYGGKEHTYGKYEILVKNALGQAMNV